MKNSRNIDKKLNRTGTRALKIAFKENTSHIISHHIISYHTISHHTIYHISYIISINHVTGGDAQEAKSACTSTLDGQKPNFAIRVSPAGTCLISIISNYVTYHISILQIIRTRVVETWSNLVGVSVIRGPSYREFTV